MRARPTRSQHASDYTLRLAGVELVHLVGDLFLIRHFAQLMDVDVAADSLLVDNDDRPLGPSYLLVEHAVGLRHFTVRPEVGAERVPNATERIGPGLQCVDRVAEDAHDL